MSESAWTSAHYMLLLFPFPTGPITKHQSEMTWPVVLPPHSEVQPQTVACCGSARLQSIVSRSDLGQSLKTFLWRAII